MKRYRHSDWLRLGRAVQAARIREGMGDMKEWAGEVGRTDRMLYGLERGESVGARTLALIEDALGWDAGQAYRVLDGEPEPAPPAVLRPALQEVSDDELLAEVARRIKGGGGRGGDTAPTSTVTVDAIEDEEGNSTAVARTRRSRRSPTVTD